MSDESFTMNVKGLDQLIKALKVSSPVTRVGILGAKPHTSKNGKSGSTNADIGAAHEFGAPARGLTQRSFLRVPVSENLEKKLESSGELNKEVLADVIKSGTIVPWMKKVAVLSEGIVAEAFDTSGGGRWPAWKTPGYTNNAGMLLVDTAQLRNSISSEVK